MCALTRFSGAVCGDNDNFPCLWFRGVYKKAVVATIDVLLPFYGGRYRARCKFPKLETKTSALCSERMSRKELSLESRMTKGEKSGSRKEELGACSVLHLEERLGHSRKPRCLRYLFFISGKEAFSIIDNAN